MKQILLLKHEKNAFGGSLFTTRKERARRRPLATKHSMHFVLRSTQAKGEWSFRHKRNPERIANIVKRFSRKYGVRIYSMANVGNHLHFHVKLSNRYAYAPFIRAISGAIALSVTGTSKLKRLQRKFWDYRPYSRVVVGYRVFLNMKDYVRINQLEGFGLDRAEARCYWDLQKAGLATSGSG